MCLLREVDNWVSGEARRARRLRAGCLKTRFVLGLYLAPSRFSNCGFMSYFWSFLQSRACVRRSRHLLGFLTPRLRRRFRSGCIFREGVSPRHRAFSPVRAFSRGGEKNKYYFLKKRNSKQNQNERERHDLGKKGVYRRSHRRFLAPEENRPGRALPAAAGGGPGAAGPPGAAEPGSGGGRRQ